VERFSPSPRVRLLAIFVAGLCCGIVFAPRAPDSYDAGIMLEVGRNLVEHGAVRVHQDYYGLNTPYASYGLATSVVMGALYAIGKAVGANAVAVAMAANALLFAVLLVALTLLARVLGANWRRSAGVALVVAISTPLLVLTSTGYSELGVAVGLTCGLIGVQLTGRSESWHGPALTGIGAGIALLFRTDSALLVAAPLLVGVVLNSPRRRAAAVAVFGAGAALLVAIWAAYNSVRFGAPWRLGYETGRAFNHSELLGLAGLLVSPSHGLITCAPVVLVAAFGARPAWRRFHVLALVGALVLALRLVLYARWWGWYGGGGWGPRLLVPAMPILVLPLLALLDSPAARRRVLVAAAVTVTVASVWIQVVGAVTLPERRPDRLAIAKLIGARTGPAEVDYLMSPAGERAADRELMKPRLQPFTSQTRALFQRTNITSSIAGSEGNLAQRLALIALFALGLAAAMWPDARPRVR
jgi:hypothetical protein